MGVGVLMTNVSAAMHPFACQLTRRMAKQYPGNGGRSHTGGSQKGERPQGRIYQRNLLIEPDDTQRLSDVYVEQDNCVFNLCSGRELEEKTTFQGYRKASRKRSTVGASGAAWVAGGGFWECLSL